MSGVSNPAYRGVSYVDFYGGGPSAGLPATELRGARAIGRDPDEYSPCKVVAMVVIVGTVLTLVLYALSMTPAGGGGCARSPYASGKRATNAAVEPIPLRSDDELEKAVAADGVAVVLFYAPWCQHCKQAYPAFVDASKLNASTRTFVADCHNHVTNAALQKFGIRGFPTVLKFSARGTKVEEYSGPRTSPAYSDFMQQ